MIQDIQPKVFHNEFTQKPIGENDFYIVVKKRQLLCRLENNRILLPSVKEFGIDQKAFHLFNIDDVGYYYSEKEFEGYQFEPGFKLRTTEDLATCFACVTGISISHWYQSNRYCGCCGHEMVKDEKERMMRCPECGNLVYPRINPVIIVGIIHENKILLVKYADRTHYAYYALVAGFAEFGESVESTIVREVKEETGLSVKNFRYFSSQPWGYSDSLIMGFYCELDGDEHFHFDDHELGVGKWCSPEEVECDEKDNVSITQLMIREFKKNGRQVLDK